MEYRKLGKTGWQVSAVSMGCWGLGGQWGEVSEKQAAETIHAAMDAGVNLFDTADSYGLGQSEIFVGKALEGKSDDIYLATKVGNWARRAGDPLGFKSVNSVYECCHASLYRLGMDTIDLYQCHIGSPENPEVFVEAFENLKKQGKIRHYAISTNNVDALKALNSNGDCASCQINYSLLSRSAEADILPYCRGNDIGVLLRGPISQGLLADKFSESTHFGDTVRQKWNPDGAQRQDFLDKLQKVAALRELVPEGMSMAELALRFTLAHPAVTCPIPGMKSPEQARANAAAADGGLSKDVLEKIDAVFPPAGVR